MGMRHFLGQPALLGAGNQVVDQDTQATAWCRPEGRYLGGQMVDPVQTLDHNPLHPEVVAPDPLDQQGVVDPLDKDSAGPSNLGPVSGDTHRTGCGA